MNLKKSLIFIFILSLILQCVSGVGLNCATSAATGLCATCGAGYQADPAAANIRNCRKTIAKCSLWTTDLKKCVECSTSAGIKYSLFVEGQSCGIDNCAVPDATNPGTQCSQCALGYRLSPNRLQCIGRIPNCNLYSSHTACKQCHPTFQPSPAFDMCLPGTIKNCQLYKATKACLLCSDNFEPISTYDMCNPGSISNCKRYYYPGKCQVCNVGYTSNVDQTRCADKIPSCKIYDANALCTTCIDTYMQNAVDGSNPLNTKCIPGTISQCKTYSANAVCQKCNDFFQPAANSASCPVGSIADCISYTSNGVCAKCADPKMPNSGACAVGSVTKCKSYSAIDICAACQTGYTLVITGGVTTCVTKITNCKTFTSDTACAVCQNTFEPTLDFSKCLAGSIVGCDQYLSKGLCKTCGLGYTINVAKTACTGRIANCKAYASATVDPTTAPNGFICDQCADTFKPDANKLTCATAPGAENCIRYSDSSTCTQCAQNFAQNTGVCETPGTPITNCQYYGTTAECRRCADTKMPLATTGASCEVGSVTNCRVYLETDVCETCSVGFTLTINPNTLDTTCVAKITNCLTFSSNTVCTGCANTFQPSLDGTSCNAGTIQKCTVYQSKGLCLTCQNGFIPNGAKTLCVNAVTNCKSYDPGNVCKECLDNFNSDVTGACVAAVSSENCLRYTYSASAIGTCNQCKTGFGFNPSPTCAAITTPIASCQLYDTLTTCNKCTDPKMPVAADAGATPPVVAKTACGTGSILNCVSYSAPGTCTACSLGFVLNGNACPPQIVTNCKTFTTSKSVCNKCNDNYEPSLDFKTCNPGLIRNCLSYTSNGKCQVCVNTFQPTADFTKCLPGTIINCQVYQTTGLCKTCATASTFSSLSLVFTPSGDKKSCQSLIANCAHYSDVTTCDLCGSGFYLTAANKVCTAGTVANCKTYTSNANTCTACADTFNLVSSTSCVAGTITDCLGYTSSTQCSRCIEGKMPIAANSGATPPITEGKTCVDGNIVNCRSYSNVRACLTCNFGYTHTPGNNPICVAKIANCDIYQTQTQCRQCVSTFQPTSDFTKCNSGSITDCNIYTSKAKCAVCVDLKQASADGSSCVIGTILKCLTYEARGKCGTCQLGYDTNTDKTQCIGKISNCNTYTSSAGTILCAACQDTYQISANSLTCTNPGQIANCKVYSANNVCGTCADSNWKQSATSCKPGAITDCLVYTSQLVCSRCIDGKMPDGTRATCINGTIDNCKSYSGNAACGLCNPGYTPTVSTGVACNGNLLHCKTYTSNTACKVCDDSYQPKIDFSECISGSIANCLTYSEKSKCSVCADGFQPTLDFTRCVQGAIPNCKTYVSKGLCAACTAAYTVSTDKIKCLDTIANCKNYNSDVKLCDLCQNTFELSTDKKSCPPGKIAGCSVYSANNVCDSCLQRYIKVSATSCKLGTIADCLAYTSDTVCQLCIDGKMPTAANNAVTPVIAAGSLCVAGTVENCKTYSGNAACGICTLGFNAVAGACTPSISSCKAFNTLTSCKQCADNFMQTADFTQCVTGTVTNCLTYSSNLKCSVCQDYYQPNLDFSKCQTTPNVAPVVNCKTYAFRGKCSVCDVGYKPSADMTACQHTIPNCKTYAQDPTTKVITCTLCQDTFEQDSTKKSCLSGDNANCLTYSNINVCTKCVDKFYLASATTCTQGTIVDCLTYTSASVCTKCVQGKMPSSNGATCIAGTLTGCKAYSANLYCSACNPGYTLTTGTCVGKIPNCKQYNSDTSCKLCNNDFEPTADTTKCLAGSLTGCKTYASKGSCTTCNPGYTVSGSTCGDTIANCKTYSVDGTTCTACKDTFEQDATNKKCLAGDNANCLTYSAMNVCTKCVDKFYLASATTCTLGTIVDCVVYNSITSCSKCADGKMPSSDRTTCGNGIISNCKSYSANAVCSTCQTGYTTVTPFTQCKSTILNCMIYASQKLCKQCIDQFELSIDAMRCDKGSISGCVAYEGYRKCAKCMINLQPNLDKSRCVSSIPNCDVYNTATTCKTCSATFEPSADFTKCNPGTIINCQVYEAIGKCFDCKIGYTKSVDAKKCNPPIPYCQTYNVVSGVTTCATCQQGFYAQSNVKCVAGSIQKCKIYATATTCNLCELGHQVTLDTTKCFKIIPNCRKYTATLDQCQICLTGFEPNLLGQCIKTIPQCLTYNDLTGLCQTCQVGYSLAFQSTFCKDNSNLCSIQGCSKCSQADYCDTCIDGLQLSLDHKKCIKCSVLGCRMCEVQNSCALCQDGLALATVFENFVYIKKCYLCARDNCKSCDSAGFCNTCDSGYTLSSGSCVPCKFPCQSCDTTDVTKCTSCVSPAYFKTPTSTGGCILSTVSNCAVYDTVTSTLCAQCQPFFKLSADKKSCERTCGANCKQCSGNSCSSCNTGFYLVNGFCYQCPQGCLQCTSSSVCTKIVSGGFFLSNNVPKACPSFCKQCNSEGTCTTFNDNYNGFILLKNGNQNVLASCQQGCQTCSPTNLEQCIVCKPGYYLKSDNKCQLCTERSCRTCDPLAPAKCLTCYPNTFKNADVCVSCGQNCLTCQDFSHPNVCTSCRLGFVLSGGVCSVGGIEQCNQYSTANDCIKCTPGYTLTDALVGGVSKIICVPCLSNCRYCAKGQPSNCIDCGDNFYLNSQNTCSACSSNCKTCTSSGCTTCNPGFRVNSGFGCSKNCVQPCATCSDSDPKICNSCILGYNFVGGSCQPQTTCNGGCKRCPPGYTLNAGTCVACTGKNCRTCDTDKSTCKSCVRGFYLDANFLCTSCSVQCETCINAGGCSQCATGYIATKSMDKPDALQCIACQGNCATCIDTTKRCATCKTGYELDGWKCIKISRIKFGITLGVSLDEFNGNYPSFLTSLGATRSDTDFIQLNSIKLGSVILQGSIDPVYSTSSSEFSTELSTIQSGLLAGQSIGGMPIVSSSVTVSGYSSPASEQSNNLGIILVIAIVIYVVHKKMTPQIKDGKLDDDTKMTSKHELQKNEFEMSDNVLRNN